MADAAASVVPIHTVVPGRARLRVPKLYRSPTIKQLLETRLPDGNGILTTSANDLTGTVLVQFGNGLELSAVIIRIEIVITAAPSDEFVSASRNGAVPPATLTMWHGLEPEAVVARVNGAAIDGLTSPEAADRLRRHGANVLPTRPRRSAFLSFLDQSTSLPVVLLIASAGLSVATGGVGDAVAIVAVVLLNAAFGFFTERQAESRIAALLNNARLTATVRRDGQLYDVQAEEVVTGDLLVLRRGSHVAADARLIDVHALRVDESALTGESVPVEKTMETLPQSQLQSQPGQAIAIADRINMVYRGTLVTGGHGVAVVVAAGQHTEIGQLQLLVLESTAPETPLQQQLRELGTQQVWIACAISGAVFVAGVLRGISVLEMLKSAVSLAVAAIPEGLPAVATTALASGLNAMLQHHVLVRRLLAIETLGSIQVAGLDKTGTLTMNRMSVVAVVAGRQPFDVVDGRIQNGGGPAFDADADLRRLLEVCVLCSETEATAGDEVKSSTEAALMEMAVASGADPRSLADAYPLRARHDRSDQRSYMATSHTAADGTNFIAIKGNPIEVLALCGSYQKDGQVHPLSDAERTAIRAENDRMADSAMRVLGFGYTHTHTDHTDQTDHDATGLDAFDGHVVWVGLAGMADPIRPRIVEFVRHLRRAGIQPVMITGDQTATARAIGRDLEMQQPDVDLFARVNPSDKLRIVRTFQQSGQVVAMTGDGINDAPALKAADVGITLGQAGTEIAQDVADVVLADDEITSLIPAIREGRRVGENVHHAIDYMTATNFSEILLMFASIAAGLGAPLNTRQLLWINLLSDVFPELAFAIEPARTDLLDRPPRDVHARVIGPGDYRRLGAQSAIMGASAMGAYAYGVGRYGVGPRSSTLGFVSLTAAQLLHALTVRRSSRAVDPSLPHRASWVPQATGFGLLVLLASQFVPGVGTALGTTELGMGDLLVSGGTAIVSFAINTIAKAWREQRSGRDGPSRR